MLLMHNTKTDVVGTDYTIEYTIIENPSDYELENILEYGIRCSLFGSKQELLSSDEVKCVTPDYGRICEMVQILKKFQVFPAHLREILCDLIELQLGKEGHFVSA